MVEPIPIPAFAPLLRLEFGVVMGVELGSAAGALEGDAEAVGVMVDTVEDVELERIFRSSGGGA